jgi:hypothetical protein
MYSGAWSAGALAGWLRGGRAVLVAGLGTLAIACGLFVRDPRLVVGAQVATIFGITVLNIVLTRYLHDARPSTIRAGVSSVVSTIGYGVFVPTALAFGLFSRGHGIFAASAFIVVPLGVMCVAVARGRLRGLQPTVTGDQRRALQPAVTGDQRRALQPVVTGGRRWAVQPAVTRGRRRARRPAEQPQPGDLRPPAPVPGYEWERVAGCAPGTLIGTALGVVPGYTGPAPAYGGPKVYRVGDPAKSLESRANTHSGRRANTLFSAGSTISGP